MTTKTDPKNKPKNYIVVNFLEIDTSLITFAEPKTNKYGGKFVKMRYDGKTLYVQYDAHVCPFGISPNKEKVKEKHQEVLYPDGKKTNGYSTSIGLPKNYAEGEGDPYYNKARELDEFFIQACIEHSVLWGLGGTAKVAVDPRAIAGYDDKGENGSWKRILKYAYKKAADNSRIYQDYPPRMEFGIPCILLQEEMGPDGKYRTIATFKPTFYDAHGVKIPNVGSSNMSEYLPNWSRVGVLASWSNISLGTYGASLKPKLEQIRIFPPDRLDSDVCLLEGEDEDDFNEDIPNALQSLTVPTRATAVAKSAVPAVPVVSVTPVAKTAAPAPVAKAPAAKAPAAKAPTPAKKVATPPPEEDVEEDVLEEEVVEEVVEEQLEEQLEEEVEEVPPPKVPATARRTVVSKTTANRK